MSNFGIVQLYSSPKPTIDWNQVYFSAESDNVSPDLKFKSAKIVSINAELLRIANFQATISTIQKYPEWPYKSNKRAENFLHKMEKKYFAVGPSALCESIEKLEDGSYRIVMDHNPTLDPTIQALELYQKYDGSNFHQIGKPKHITKKYTALKDDIEC